MSKLELNDFDGKTEICYNCFFNGGKDTNDSGYIICDNDGRVTNPKTNNLSYFVKDNVDGIIRNIKNKKS